MKKIIYLFCAIALLFQSCYTYKTASVDTLEAKKRYVIELQRGGKEIEGKFITRTNDSLTFRVNKTTLNFPISEIKSIQRKKISPYIIGGSVAAVTLGTIILISSSNDDQNDISAIPTPNN